MYPIGLRVITTKTGYGDDLEMTGTLIKIVNLDNNIQYRYWIKLDYRYDHGTDSLIYRKEDVSPLSKLGKILYV